jgi:hypothetical protein
MEQQSERPDIHSDQEPQIQALGDAGEPAAEAGVGADEYADADTGAVARDVEDDADAEWDVQDDADAEWDVQDDADAEWDVQDDAGAALSEGRDVDAVTWDAGDEDAVAWDSGQAAGGAVTAPDEPEQRPATGEPRVDAALARLDELSGRPVTEHRAIFEDVHRRLRDVLGELDTREQDSGDQPAGAGAERRAGR